MKRSLAGFILLLCISAAFSCRAEDDGKLQSILGINWSELRACQADDDCTLIHNFADCCTNMAINKKYQSAIQQNLDALSHAFPYPARCALAECAPPAMSHAACEQNQCVQRFPPPPPPAPPAPPPPRTGVNIISPPDHFGASSSKPVFLSGNGYDQTDGTLPDSALTWTSDIQGTLGSGSNLSVHLSPGKHTITLTGTASDNYTASKSITAIIGGQPPVITISVATLDKAPTTCAYVTISAAPGTNGAELTSVEYSMDGGHSYVAIPREKLPFGFMAPSGPNSSFFHIVARAEDASRQTHAKDTSFFTGGTCRHPEFRP